MKSKLVLSALTVALLSACGGSGDDGANNTSIVPADVTTPSNSNANNNGNTNNSGRSNNGGNANTNNSGNANTNNGGNANNNNANNANNGGNQGGNGKNPDGLMGTLHVSGGAEIGQSFDSSRDTITSTTNTGRKLQLKLPIGGQSYKEFSTTYTHIGAFVTPELGASHFARGNHTPPENLPQSGQASYRGNSILHFFGTSIADYLKTETGTAELNADFGDKSFTFKIDTPSHHNTAKGNIDRAAGFTAPSTDPKRPTPDSDVATAVLGFFAGPRAEEAYGVYTNVNMNNGQLVQGSFSVKQ